MVAVDVVVVAVLVFEKFSALPAISSEATLRFAGSPHSDSTTFITMCTAFTSVIDIVVKRAKTGEAVLITTEDCSSHTESDPIKGVLVMVERNGDRKVVGPVTELRLEVTQITKDEHLEDVWRIARIPKVHNRLDPLLRVVVRLTKRGTYISHQLECISLLPIKVLVEVVAEVARCHHFGVVDTADLECVEKAVGVPVAHLQQILLSHLMEYSLGSSLTVTANLLLSWQGGTFHYGYVHLERLSPQRAIIF